jgi:Tol biopolymer transport system component
MLFHVRVTNGGTVIVNDGNLSKIDLKRDNTISAGVYPSWHPTEKLVAFSTNTTRQMMHTVNKNKTEVFDLASDLILYDIAKDEVSVVSDDTTRLEVFPTWSPDGKFLYYCSTLSDSVKRNIKSNYKNLKYNL